jgi:hypothetical protein
VNPGPGSEIWFTSSSTLVSMGRKSKGVMKDTPLG